jgi:hypothetical protein
MTVMIVSVHLMAQQSQMVVVYVQVESQGMNLTAIKTVRVYVLV